MKNLAKTTGVTLISLPLIFNVGCKQKLDREETYLVRGTVFSERYMPASGGWKSYGSRYSFSIDTENYGRISIIVDDAYSVPKESIDALIEKGSVVKVEDLIATSSPQVYKTYADKIEVSK